MNADIPAGDAWDFEERAAVCERIYSASNAEFREISSLLFRAGLLRLPDPHLCVKDPNVRLRHGGQDPGEAQK